MAANKVMTKETKQRIAELNKQLKNLKGVDSSKSVSGSVSKTDLVSMVAKELNLNTKDVLAVINSYNQAIKNNVFEGHNVSIQEFGTFKSYTTPKRKINKMFGEKITPKTVGGRQTMKFHASKV